MGGCAEKIEQIYIAIGQISHNLQFDFPEKELKMYTSVQQRNHWILLDIAIEFLPQDQK